jgi:hypothetical protein
MLTARSFFASVLTTSAIALSVFACDGSSSEDERGDDAFAVAGESELKASDVNGFVGRWTTGDTLEKNDFVSLTLEAGGRYQAEIAACPTAPAGGVGCLEAPRAETGSFSMLRSGSTQTLRLVPSGSRVRRYQIAFAPTVAVVGAPRAIELTRSGKSQVMNEDKDGGGAGEPCGGIRCGVGLVCCNSLSEICTQPGELCAQ